MKLTDISQIRGLNGTPATQDPVRPAAPEPKTADRVSTDESSRLATAIAAVGQNAGTGRAARLQAIETAVRQGTYRPDPQAIAQQILDDAELAARLQALFSR